MAEDTNKGPLVEMSNALVCEFRCPICSSKLRSINNEDRSWYLIPIVTLLEIFIGVRQYKETMICDNCDDEELNRLYTVCAGCGSVYSQGLWFGVNSFFHWEGKPCPACGKDMCDEYVSLSKVVLFILSPLWWLPWKLIGNRVKLLQKEKLEKNIEAALSKKVDSALFVSKRIDLPHPGNRNYRNAGVYSGVSFALVVWLIMHYVVGLKSIVEYPLKSATFVLIIGYFYGRSFEKVLRDARQKFLMEKKADGDRNP